MFSKRLLLVWGLASVTVGGLTPRQYNTGDCPGYALSNVQSQGSSITADLTLAGDGCNIYGNDLTDLKLQVEYQTGA